MFRATLKRTDAGAYVEKDGKKVYYTTSEAAQNANPDVPGDVKTYCVTVVGVKYASLSEAIAVAGEGAEMSLIADVAESVTVPAGKNIVLDLAGFTLTGSDNGKGGVNNTITNKGVIVLDLAGFTLAGGDNGKGGVNNTITNKGVLTIKDSSAAKSGAVMGGTDTGSGTAGRSGIALVNEGPCTIESGTVKRGDDGTFGNYTVYNKEAGTMIIKGGAVTNNSNTSSLIRNDGVMEIAGGEITHQRRCGDQQFQHQLAHPQRRRDGDCRRRDHPDEIQRGEKRRGQADHHRRRHHLR